MGLEHGGCGWPKRGTESYDMIYLASTSARRRVLLKKAGISFHLLKPDYAEDDTLKGIPSKVVRIHAFKKAQSCLGLVQNGIILAADTVVYLKGQIIGKPKNMRDARHMLGMLQGRWHVVYTGVAIFRIDHGKAVKKVVFFERTKVHIKKLTSKAINHYFKRVNPLDKAGAYAIQSSHGGIVQEIKGPLSNAIGLPIERVIKQLEVLAVFYPDSLLKTAKM